VTTAAHPGQREHLQGIDCAWLAIDAGGRVAVFYTAGEGPIHDDAEPYDAVAGDTLRRLPCTSTFELLAVYPRADDLVVAAQRGLFVYDWSDVHRIRREVLEGYELVARPHRPLHWTQLPEGLRGVASVARLDVEFGVPVMSRFAVTG
jgi:hypothetical protein